MWAAAALLIDVSARSKLSSLGKSARTARPASVMGVCRSSKRARFSSPCKCVNAASSMPVWLRTKTFKADLPARWASPLPVMGVSRSESCRRRGKLASSFSPSSLML